MLGREGRVTAFSWKRRQVGTSLDVTIHFRSGEASMERWKEQVHFFSRLVSEVAAVTLRSFTTLEAIVESFSCGSECCLE